MVGLDSLRRVLGQRLLRWADVLLQQGGAAAPAVSAPPAEAGQQDGLEGPAPSARELWEARVAAWAVQPGQPPQADDEARGMAAESGVRHQDTPVPSHVPPPTPSPSAGRGGVQPSPQPPRNTPAPRAVHPAAPMQRPAHAPAARPAHRAQADAGLATARQAATRAAMAWHAAASSTGQQPVAGPGGFHAPLQPVAQETAARPERGRSQPHLRARRATPFGPAAAQPAAPPEIAARPLPKAALPDTARTAARVPAHAAGHRTPAPDAPSPHAAPSRPATPSVAPAHAVRSTQARHVPPRPAAGDPARPPAMPAPRQALYLPAPPAAAPLAPAAPPAPAAKPRAATVPPATAAARWPDLPPWPPVPADDPVAAAGSTAQRLQRLEREHRG